eukprot:359855-Chlamydomonas_euryale.AAC.6
MAVGAHARRRARMHGGGRACRAAGAHAGRRARMHGGGRACRAAGAHAGQRGGMHGGGRVCRVAGAHDASMEQGLTLTQQSQGLATQQPRRRTHS